MRWQMVKIFMVSVHVWISSYPIFDVYLRKISFFEKSLHRYIPSPAIHLSSDHNEMICSMKPVDCVGSSFCMSVPIWVGIIRKIILSKGLGLAGVRLGLEDLVCVVRGCWPNPENLNNSDYAFLLTFSSLILNTCLCPGSRLSSSPGVSSATNAILAGDKVSQTNMQAGPLRRTLPHAQVL